MKRDGKKISRASSKRAVRSKNSVRVKKVGGLKRVQRVKTGVSAFDGFIEGGFEKDSTNLIVGGPGSGKSILATQFLVEGLKNKEKCLYVTFEEKKEQFYSNMKRFGFDLEEYERKGLFSFLEYTPVKVKTMLEEGGGEIESIILKKKVSRMVIDSISSFEILFDSELERREASLELFNMLKKWNCTTLLTLESKASKGGRIQLETLEFESDSIILLHFVRKLLKRERFIEILKMRGTNHSKEIHKFEIGKAGISLGRKAEKI